MIINIFPGTSRLGQFVINHLINSGINPNQLVGTVRNDNKVRFLSDRGISVRLGDYEHEDT